MGVGFALPLMFNIILEQVPSRKIGLMMGVGTLITAVAPAIGPTVGGLLTAHLVGVLSSSSSFLFSWLH